MVVGRPCYVSHVIDGMGLDFEHEESDTMRML